MRAADLRRGSRAGDQPRQPVVGGRGPRRTGRDHAGMLLAMGARPDILSRGYGRAATNRASRGPRSARIRPESSGRRRAVDAGASADGVCVLTVPILLPHVADAGARRESRLDDGFQHFQLDRDIDLVSSVVSTWSSVTLPTGGCASARPIVADEHFRGDVGSVAGCLAVSASRERPDRSEPASTAAAGRRSRGGRQRCARARIQRTFVRRLVCRQKPWPSGQHRFSARTSTNRAAARRAGAR